MDIMNYKLEKFWNYISGNSTPVSINMNYKLEKFWNANTQSIEITLNKWTINLKSFEIIQIQLLLQAQLDEL